MKTEFWKKKNVLITGSDGFIGSNLAKELIKREAYVITLLRKNKPNGGLALQGITNKVIIVKGSVCDYSLLKKIIKKGHIDYCFHLAAQSIIQVANESPISTFKTNIKGTWTILEAFRNNKKISGIIIASSYKAYGKRNIPPYREEFGLFPSYPYETSKTCAELLARTYAHTFDLPIAVTRCANAYGGGDMNFSRIVPATITSVLQNKNPIIKGNGSSIRDYIYIDDIIEAYLLLAERVREKGIMGNTFNFGRDEPISVLELIKKIIYLFEKKWLIPLIKYEEESLGEIDKQYISSQKAKRILNWQAKYDLNSGLKKTIAWYKEYFKKIKR